ncbi:MAG: rod shape-determining protein MreD [Nitrospinota bacterium]|nr:rod shape-determining protein MreD [Nitrospinota bacterium]
MKIVQYVIVAWVFFIIQSASFSIIPGIGFRPDMALILVVHFALAFGRSGGLAFGAGAGLFQDLLLCGPVGPGVLSWGLAGYASGALREIYISDTLRSRAALMAAVTLSDIVIRASMVRMASDAQIGHAAMAAMGPQVVVNVFFAILAMPLLSWLDQTIGGAETRMEKRKKLNSFLSGMRKATE